MTKFFIRIVVLSAFFCIQPVWLSAQNNFEVRKINFKGNKTLEKDFLLERMAMKEVSWLQKKLTKKEPFLYNYELIQLDLERLRRIYQSEGFLEAHVQLQPLKINEKKKTVKLTIEVKEGEAVVVDSIDFELVEAAASVKTDSLAKEVLKEVKLEKGDRFRDEALLDDILGEFSKNCVSFICEFTIFSFDLLDAIFKEDFAVSQGRRRHGAVYIPLTNCKIDLTLHL